MQPVVCIRSTYAIMIQNDCVLFRLHLVCVYCCQLYNLLHFSRAIAMSVQRPCVYDNL